jgi:hypothetical protein
MLVFGFAGLIDLMVCWWCESFLVAQLMSRVDCVVVIL